MKNQKGITLITLVITIVILIIITGVVTYNGLESVNTSQKTAFISELEMIQAKVNVIYEERKASTEKVEYYNLIGQDISNIDQIRINEALGQTSKDGFRFFNPSDLKKLDLDNINQEILINYDTREVISLTGLEIDGVKYYKLKDIPNYIGYNVDYTNSNTQAPEFTVSQTKLGENEYRFRLENIVYNSNVNGGTVKYKKHSETNWILNGESTSFTVKEPGLYDICFTDRAGNETIKQELIYEFDYIKNGVLAYYDGENNIQGEHNSTTEIWEDLSGNGNNANLTNVKFNETSGWIEKAIQLSGNGDKITFPVKIPKAGTFSVEIILKEQNYGKFSIINSDKEWRTFNAHTYGSGNIYIGGNYLSSSSDRFTPGEINYSLPLNKTVSLTYTYDGESKLATFYINGKEICKKAYKADPDAIEFFYIEGAQKQYNRVSFYNKALTQDEITYNYEIDKYRFGIEE